jgi:hypothetical protein
MEMQLGGVPRAELQQDLQRFVGTLCERIEQAADEGLAHAAHPTRSAAVLNRALTYEAAALEIATGQVPEVNLLDMIVFLTLSRDAFEAHWWPQIFGPAGPSMLQALDGSLQELWSVADKVFAPAQEEQLRDLIGAWKRENPAQVHVENVRLAHFSKLHGDAAASARQRGLLAGVKTATKTADDALWMGERALFLAQRLPFTMRLQVRVGLLELLGDGKSAAERLDRVARRWIAYLTLAGVAWIAIFWLGYRLAR